MNKKTKIEQFMAHTFSGEGRGKKVKRRPKLHLLSKVKLSLSLS
jgi:hypothetical protein